MATMPDTETFVTLGVDTHKDTHLAVALDQLGRWLDAIEIPTTSAGYAEPEFPTSTAPRPASGRGAEGMVRTGYLPALLLATTLAMH